MPQDVVYRRSPDVVAASLGDKSFLLHTGDWVYLELNGSGSRIWELLDAGQTAAALAGQLVVEFDVEAGTCERETEEFLATLTEKHFLLASEPEAE